MVCLLKLDDLGDAVHRNRICSYGLKSEAGIFWLLFIITAIVSIWKIIASMKKMKTGPHSDFNVLKNDMETLLRLLRRDYGASGQVRRLADDVEAQVFSIVNGRDAALRRNRLISAIIVVLVSALMILAIVGIFAIVI